MRRVNRRAFTLLEICVALTVLLMAFVVGMTAWAGAVRDGQKQDRRAAAREAVVLQLERLRTVGAAALPETGKSIEIALPAELAQRIGKARCTVKRVGAANGKLIRLRVEVAWGIPAQSGLLESGECTLPQ